MRLNMDYPHYGRTNHLFSTMSYEYPMSLRDVRYRFEGLVGRQLERLREERAPFVIQNFASLKSAKFPMNSSPPLVINRAVDDFTLDIQRNSNALCNMECDGPNLYGLPCFARCMVPLMRLLMTAVEDSSNSGLRNNRCEILNDLQEAEKTLMTIHKRCAILEQQLHQYVNPNLVTSLNRRSANATCEGDLLVKAIDKLRKTSVKASKSPEVTMRVCEISTKIKSLLLRQKCEWQCVGRLKETLTMAREMKSVLKFICQLTFVLQQNNDTLTRSLCERPPPYETSSLMTESRGRDRCQSHERDRCQSRGRDRCQSRGRDRCQSRSVDQCHSRGRDPCQSRGRDPCISRSPNPCLSRSPNPCLSRSPNPCLPRSPNPCPPRTPDPCPLRGRYPCQSLGYNPRAYGRDPFQSSDRDPCQSRRTDPSPSRARDPIQHSSEQPPNDEDSSESCPPRERSPCRARCSQSDMTISVSMDMTEGGYDSQGKRVCCKRSCKKQKFCVRKACGNASESDVTSCCSPKKAKSRCGNKSSGSCCGCTGRSNTGKQRSRCGHRSSTSGKCGSCCGHSSTGAGTPRMNSDCQESSRRMKHKKGSCNKKRGDGSPTILLCRKAGCDQKSNARSPTVLLCRQVGCNKKCANSSPSRQVCRKGGCNNKSADSSPSRQVCGTGGCNNKCADSSPSRLTCQNCKPKNNCRPRSFSPCGSKRCQGNERRTRSTSSSPYTQVSVSSPRFTVKTIACLDDDKDPCGTCPRQQLKTPPPSPRRGSPSPCCRKRKMCKTGASDVRPRSASSCAMKEDCTPKDDKACDILTRLADQCAAVARCKTSIVSADSDGCVSIKLQGCSYKKQGSPPKKCVKNRRVKCPPKKSKRQEPATTTKRTSSKGKSPLRRQSSHPLPNIEGSRDHLEETIDDQNESGLEENQQNEPIREPSYLEDSDDQLMELIEKEEMGLQRNMRRQRNASTPPATSLRTRRLNQGQLVESTLTLPPSSSQRSVSMRQDGEARLSRDQRSKPELLHQSTSRVSDRGSQDVERHLSRVQSNVPELLHHSPSRVSDRGNQDMDRQSVLSRVQSFEPKPLHQSPSRASHRSQDVERHQSKVQSFEPERLHRSPSRASDRSQKVERPLSRMQSFEPEQLHQSPSRASDRSQNVERHMSKDKSFVQESLHQSPSRGSRRRSQDIESHLSNVEVVEPELTDASPTQDSDTRRHDLEMRLSKDYMEPVSESIESTESREPLIVSSRDSQNQFQEDPTASGPSPDYEESTDLNNDSNKDHLANANQQALNHCSCTKRRDKWCISEECSLCLSSEDSILSKKTFMCDPLCGSISSDICDLLMSTSDDTSLSDHCLSSRKRAHFSGRSEKKRSKSCSPSSSHRSKSKSTSCSKRPRREPRRQRDATTSESEPVKRLRTCEAQTDKSPRQMEVSCQPCVPMKQSTCQTFGAAKHSSCQTCGVTKQSACQTCEDTKHSACQTCPVTCDITNTGTQTYVDVQQTRCRSPPKDECGPQKFSTPVICEVSSSSEDSGDSCCECSDEDKCDDSCDDSSSCDPCDPCCNPSPQCSPRSSALCSPPLDLCVPEPVPEPCGCDQCDIKSIRDFLGKCWKHLLFAFLLMYVLFLLLGSWSSSPGCGSTPLPNVAMRFFTIASRSIRLRHYAPAPV